MTGQVTSPATSQVADPTMSGGGSSHRPGDWSGLVNPIGSKAEQKRVRSKQRPEAIRFGFFSGGLLEVAGNCHRREMIASFGI